MNTSPALLQCYTAMANSIGIAMHNASTNQHSGQMISNASTSVVTAMIIQKGLSS